MRYSKSATRLQIHTYLAECGILSPQSECYLTLNDVDTLIMLILLIAHNTGAICSAAVERFLTILRALHILYSAFPFSLHSILTFPFYVLL